MTTLNSYGSSSREYPLAPKKASHGKPVTEKSFYVRAYQV